MSGDSPTSAIRMEAVSLIKEMRGGEADIGPCVNGPLLEGE